MVNLDEYNSDVVGGIMCAHCSNASLFLQRQNGHEQTAASFRGASPKRLKVPDLLNVSWLTP
jgi:hypothetical protein